MKDKGKLTYTPGMFHLYMITDALDFWNDFPEKMIPESVKYKL